MRCLSLIVAAFLCSASALALDTGMSAIVGGTASVVRDTRADTLIAATQALQLALQQRHAEVTQWSIRPLVNEHALQALPTTTPSDVRVTHTGARSAVRLTWAEASHATTLWFEVSGTASAVVTNRDLAPGAVVSPADALFAERNVMEVSCVMVSDPAQLQQMRTRRALRAGTPICREAIEPRPAVVRGEDVVVRFVSPRVSITSKGIAQADARIGQNVVVMNAASRDAFRAVVSALKEVVVYE